MIIFSPNAVHSSVNRARIGQPFVHPLIDSICVNNPFPARQISRLLYLIFKAYYLDNWPAKFHFIWNIVLFVSKLLRV